VRAGRQAVGDHDHSPDDYHSDDHHNHDEHDDDDNHDHYHDHHDLHDDHDNDDDLLHDDHDDHHELDQSPSHHHYYDRSRGLFARGSSGMRRGLPAGQLLPVERDELLLRHGDARSQSPVRGAGAAAELLLPELLGRVPAGPGLSVVPAEQLQLRALTD
jgi:hypothetical protein